MVSFCFLISSAQGLYLKNASFYNFDFQRFLKVKLWIKDCEPAGEKPGSWAF